MPLQLGSIYKIANDDHSIAYVGSTFKDIRERFKQHKGMYRRWVAGHKPSCAIFEAFEKHGTCEFDVYLIKEYLVTDKYHLRAYEQLHMNRLKSTNINNAIGIRYVIPRERVYNPVYARKYYDSHRDQCIKYQHDHRAEHYARLKRKIECPCGATITKGSKPSHIRSMRHLDALKARSSESQD